MVIIKGCIKAEDQEPRVTWLSTGPGLSVVSYTRVCRHGDLCNNASSTRILEDLSTPTGAWRGRAAGGEGRGGEGCHKKGGRGCYSFYQFSHRAFSVSFSEGALPSNFVDWVDGSCMRMWLYPCFCVCSCTGGGGWGAGGSAMVRSQSPQLMSLKQGFQMEPGAYSQIR